MNKKLALYLQRLVVILGAAIAICGLTLFALDLTRFPNFTYFQGQLVFPDFWLFWSAAQLALKGQAVGVYDPAIFTAQLSQLIQMNPAAQSAPFYYPPTFLLFLMPFGLLPYFVAGLTFYLFSLAVFMLMVWTWSRRGWAVVAMLGFLGVWVNLSVGQNGLLTAGLLGLALAWRDERPVLGALALAMLLIKPHFGILLPLVLLVGGHWRCFLYTCLFALLFILATVLAFGIDVWWAFPNGIMVALKVLWSAEPLLMRMSSLFAFLRLGGLEQPLPMQIQSYFAMFVALVTLVFYFRARTQPALGAALVASAAMLVTPFMYDYDLALLAIPLVLLARVAWQRGLCWADWVLLPLAFAWPAVVNWLPYMTGLQFGFVVPLALWILTLCRLWRGAFLPVAPSLG